MTDRPRVGISRCLLGDEVRYDGTHKRDDALVGTLGRHVEWVPVCPEVEVGMGTPREPIQLVARHDGVPSASERARLIGVSSGHDWTDLMQGWAQERVRTLMPLNLSGYIFKARSPSCGVHGVPVQGGNFERAGRGLFAQALIDSQPDLPVEDEEGLADPRAREEFLQRVLHHHARRA
jgi:uncharacterized protein YbbK (DUF523 family)